MEKKYNGMFRISEQKIKFHNKETGETHHKGIGERDKYDLRNENTYDMEGNLIEEASQMDNNTTFALFFPRAHVLEVKDYLTHHYNYTPNKELFLDYVEHGIMPDQNFAKGGIKGIMNDWIMEKRNELSKEKESNKELQRKNEITLKLIGYIGNYNSANTTQPVYYYINDVLKEFNLTPLEAKEIVLQMRGSVSPDWNKNVIPFIIEHLKESQPQIISQLKTENKEPKNEHPKIFKNGFAWEMFLELKKLSVDKNPLADYSFIYFKMFDKKLGAINETVTHPIFIKFLNEYCDADISSKKLIFKNQSSKQQLYSTTLNKFKDDILSNP